jgi:hypothetical protein
MSPTYIFANNYSGVDDKQLPHIIVASPTLFDLKESPFDVFTPVCVDILGHYDWRVACIVHVIVTAEL